jgi:hypothetical protein
MRIDAIGAESSLGLDAWANVIAAGQAGGGGIDRLVAVAGSKSSMDELLGAIAGSGLPPSTRVELSEAAVALFALDATDGNTTLSELAQALLVALILELLEPAAAAA